MAEHPSYPSLEVHESMPLQQRLWRLQRIGWLLLALFMLAGLLGVLGGSGVLNRTVVGNAGATVLVEHPRFTRYVAPTELSVQVDANVLVGDTLEVAISRSYIDVFEMYGISPQPEGERAEGDDLVYEFAVVPGEDAEFTFFGRPHAVGNIAGSVQVGQGERLAFSTWVYP